MSFKFIFSLCLFNILYLGFAQAQSLSFEDSKPIYQTLKNRYDAEESAIQQDAAARIASIDQQIQGREADFLSCTSFDCRRQIRNQINRLEADKKDIQTQTTIAVMEKAKIFVKEAQVIAVNAFVFESLRMAAADNRLEHFIVKSVTTCGSADFLDYSISPSRAMTCKQMNVEVKLRDRFYKLSTAVGLRYSGNDHQGNSVGINAADEVAYMNSIFALSTADFMADLDGVKVFFGGPGVRPTWSQVIFDNRGDAQFYAMYNPFWMGRYTVSIDSI